MSTNFSPSPSELALVSQIFAQADPQRLGILTGDVAVKVFGGAKLPPAVLGEIWNIADEDNNGWLPRKGVAIAIRLIGWAQKGEKITPTLLFKPGPLPIIDGVTPLAQQHTGMSIPKSPPPTLPPLTPQERIKFQTLFAKSGPGPDGLLSASKARDVFLKSKLNNDTLLKIWNLADTQDRGSLDSADFAIGMYFIQGMMSGQITFVPSTLPPGLHQQAGGQVSTNSGSLKAHITGSGITSGSFSPSTSGFSDIQPQHTGQPDSPFLQPSYTGLGPTPSRPPPAVPPRSVSTSFSGAPFVPPRHGHLLQWDISPAEKATSDKAFYELDTHKRGYIEGDVAVPYMLKSQLPEDDLARIWDLADLNNNGMLTKDGLAVATYLMQKRLSGGDIPRALPDSLIPPSMRTNIGTQIFHISGSNPPASEPVRDLLWDDTPPNSATLPMPSHPTGQTLTPSTTVVPAQKPLDPFAAPASLPGMSSRNFLDDDDEGQTSPSLHDQSAEIGNVQNQLSSTLRSKENMKTERVNIEQTLASQASQLAALQTQLSSAKAACETETKLLANLKERQAAQNAEMQKAKEDLIRAESDLSAVRVEKAETEGAFMRDKEDARELNRKIIEVGRQVEVSKAEVEKLKKDAKHQKGLLAIAKKQLSSKEAEKAKAEKELEDAASELVSVNKELEEAEAELAATVHQTPARVASPDVAAAQPLPPSPETSSLNGSVQTAKSNNPFERLTRAPSTPDNRSPFLSFPVSSANVVDTQADVPSNPFGLAESFKAEPDSFDAIFHEPEETVRAATPKPDHVQAGPTSEPGEESMLSTTTVDGETDQFVTPPTSANGHDRPESMTSSSPSLSASFPAIDDVATKFPDIQADDSKANDPAQHSAEHVPVEGETDLREPLKELEVEDSDSDSDQEDEVPLAQLAKSKSNDGRSTSLAQASSLTNTDVSGTSFDDVFGVTPPSAANGQNGVEQTTKETPAAVAPRVTSTGEHTPTVVPPSGNSTTSEPTVAGVSAFDEAMGIISTSTSATPKPFTFDAFDDNFDFASAVNESVPLAPPPAPATVPNGNQKENLDAIFGMPATTQNGTFVRPYEAAPANGNGTLTTKSGFDEVFSSLDTSPHELESSFASITTRASTSSDRDRASTNQTAFPSSSPQSAAPSSPLTPASPIRTKSPPPRTSSPRGRPSTSSSKDVPEKPKDVPTRSSKLSIRLPFGRKKKQQQHEPLPPSLPSPSEDRIASSTIDDDIESVKQIIAMGFTRAQAVQALEQNSYDVNRALNNLLGA